MKKELLFMLAIVCAVSIEAMQNVIRTSSILPKTFIKSTALLFVNEQSLIDRCCPSEGLYKIHDFLLQRHEIAQRILGFHLAQLEGNQFNKNYTFYLQVHELKRLNTHNINDFAEFGYGHDVCVLWRAYADRTCSLALPLIRNTLRCYTQEEKLEYFEEPYVPTYSKVSQAVFEENMQERSGIVAYTTAGASNMLSEHLLKEVEVLIKLN